MIVERPEGLPEAARALLAEVGDARVFALYGKMGAGKTAFIAALVQALGVAERSSSPTYALVNEYLGGDGEPVYHFDFYRIESVEEAYDMGFDEYVYSGHYCFIEWPERIAELLPDEAVSVFIEVMGGGARSIRVEVPE
ncbi:MAG: tRNA (adenosine(37)-N6)-threonylcarbamoyltransferase complex ATPase subunit type 1 TsaE [Cryomorphaceae bacterium]|nr:tRNA (adenosine(37)-N6)-threonylcarbamoyltransferase complex ATPase subunit type 1 TsaE [Flavobacteriales bacterium]